MDANLVGKGLLGIALLLAESANRRAEVDAFLALAGHGEIFALMILDSLQYYKYHPVAHG